MPQALSEAATFLKASLNREKYDSEIKAFPIDLTTSHFVRVTLTRSALRYTWWAVLSQYLPNGYFLRVFFYQISALFIPTPKSIEFETGKEEVKAIYTPSLSNLLQQIIPTKFVPLWPWHFVLLL